MAVVDVKFCLFPHFLFSSTGMLYSILSLNDCIGYQEMTLLRSTTVVRMQCLVPNCIVLASEMSLYRVSLYQEMTVLCRFLAQEMFLYRVSLKQEITVLCRLRKRQLYKYCSEVIIPPSVISADQWKVPSVQDVISCYTGSVHLKVCSLSLQVFCVMSFLCNDSSEDLNQ